MTYGRAVAVSCKNSNVLYSSVEDERVSRPLLSAYIKDCVSTVDLVINYV
jgi:hypothetical protein